jgi:hypothetical protein
VNVGGLEASNLRLYAAEPIDYRRMFCAGNAQPLCHEATPGGKYQRYRAVPILPSASFLQGELRLTYLP